MALAFILTASYRSLLFICRYASKQVVDEAVYQVCKPQWPLLKGRERYRQIKSDFKGQYTKKKN